MKERNGIKLKVFGWATMAAASVMLIACDVGNVGDQPAAGPVADATVLGAGVSSSPFSVRSGMDVLISGKDSYGTDGPILEYEWSIANVSGSVLTAADIEQSLYERTVNTKLFRAPKVSERTLVEFTLTVTDAEGDTDSDTVEVDIEPVLDPDLFLLQGAVSDSTANTYELVAALNLSAGEVTNSSFSIAVTTIFEWLPREPHPDCVFGESGDRCQDDLDLPPLTLSGTWPADQSDTGVDPQSRVNPPFRIPLPTLNIDDINQRYEDADREKRIELADVNEARVFQRFVFAADNNSRLLITKDRVDTGLLALDRGGESDLIDLEKIKREVGTESRDSANVYYKIIDPDSRYERFSAWQAATGLTGDPDQADVAHAIYVNNFDLGFGRDMFMRRDECGNVYSYVSNYPTLEATLKGIGNFAIVVMEYSPLDNDAPCSDAEKIVKFYAYVPDNVAGDPRRMASMNFDGRGERLMPGVCTACHGGSPAALQSFLRDQGPRAVDAMLNKSVDTLAKVEIELASLSDPADPVDASVLADLDSTFMLFDLDSFLYTQSGNPDEIDPGLNLANLPASVDSEVYSREAQLNDFRELNKGALFTFLHKRETETDPDLDGRFDAPVELANTWYGSMIEDSAMIESLDLFDFDGTRRLMGWESEPDLHDDVFARYCRACHIQLSNQDENFDTVQEFLENEELTDQALVAGKMPMARLTMDRFWADSDGDGSVSAEMLQSELGTMDVPGRPNARIVLSDELLRDIGQMLQINGTRSSFVEDFSWELIPLNGCNTTSLIAATTLQPSFISDLSPCEYTIQLSVLSNGVVASTEEKNFLVDRAPVVANRFVAPSAPFQSYVAGASSASLVVNVSQVSDEGDGGATIIDLTDLDSTDATTFVANAGAVTVTFPALQGSNGVFEYKLKDFNDTVSEQTGTVDINVPKIVPMVSAASTITGVNLTWTVATGFQADDYVVSREDAPNELNPDQDLFDDFTTTVTGTSYPDEGLNPQTKYRYRVEARVGGDTSDPFDTAIIETDEAAVPRKLTATAGLTSVQLAWDPPDGVGPGEVKSYQVREQIRGIIASGLTSTDFLDEDAVPNTDYIYNVRAVYDDAGDVTSNFSNTEPASTNSVPAPERAGLSIPGVQTTDSEFTFQWLAPPAGIPAGTAVAYNVYKGSVATTPVNGGSPISNTSLVVGYSSGDGAFSMEVATVVEGVESTRTALSIEQSYIDDIFPIIGSSNPGTLAADCQSCHFTGTTRATDYFIDANDSDFTWEELRDDAQSSEGPSGPILNFSVPTGSNLLVCVSNGCGNMNSRTVQFSTAEKQRIIDWLNQGGLRN